jgi:glycosyltransferase involved in cell wall biosynthesis
MKIVHLCLANFYIDNYSYQENLLPKYHVLQGYEVTVIASLVSIDTNGKPCLLDSESTNYTLDGFKVIRVDYDKPFYFFNKFVRFYKKIYLLLENERPDILFLHDFSFMDITEIIRYVKKNKSVRVYIDCHTDFINSGRTWISRNIFHKIIWRYYAKKLTPFVSKFYGTTPIRCDFLRDVYRINPQKIELLVMGVDNEQLKFKNRLDIRTSLIKNLEFCDNDFIIVSGGKIDQQKNIHLLLQAVYNINKPNIKLVVFGTVNPDLQDFFDLMLTSKSISFVGWQNSDKILDYFIFADLIVFPGTHSVLWEQAVGVGIPCVFKYWEGITHIDLGGNCEFLYEDKVDEIEYKLLSIINNQNKYAQMKNNAIEKGLLEFSYDAIAERAIRN